jgi:recombination protein RecT
MAATKNAPAPRQQAPVPPAPQAPPRLRAVLEASADRIRATLPAHLTPERMTQVVTTLVYRTPKLQECDPHSVLAAVLQGAALGLDFAPGMNEAFLIPRWNSKARLVECQFQPGYQGLRKLAMQSGEVATIQARVVREGDVFQVLYAPELTFRHVPVFGQAGGHVTHVYAVARLRAGDHVIEVMDRAEVEAIRRRSQSADAGPWVTDWDEMAKKTVIKRLCKSLPRSLELAEAIEADNREYDLGDVTPRQGALAGRGAAGLAGRLGAPPAPEPEPEFAAGEGVSRPVYSEDDDAQALAEAEALDRAEGT